MTKSILVADDDPKLRALLEFRLRNDYDVTVVEDGQECWEYLDSHRVDPPDVVVLDVMMPGVDGYRVLDRMEADEQFDAVDVIMLTSRGTEEDVVRALESGATDYMTKPFSPNELAARIERVL
jgi:DNA-binding response OmpR family regulator